MTFPLPYSTNKETQSNGGKRLVCGKLRIQLVVESLVEEVLSHAIPKLFTAGMVTSTHCEIIVYSGAYG